MIFSALTRDDAGEVLARIRRIMENQIAEGDAQPENIVTLPLEYDKPLKDSQSLVLHENADGSTF